MYTINDLYENDLPDTGEEKFDLRKSKENRKKYFKKVCKQLSKHEKCLKKLSKQMKCLKKQKKVAETNTDNKQKKDEKTKSSFWSRLQDTVIKTVGKAADKAVSIILTVAVGSLVRYFCEGKKLRHALAAG